MPRFRQLLYRPRWGLGWPLWVDAASFDLADHIRVHPLAAPGDEAQLLVACAQLSRRRLDPSRPLWEAWLLPGLPQQQVGLLLRAHHTLVDGVAGGLRRACPPHQPQPSDRGPSRSIASSLGRHAATGTPR